jgi:hypothetical protein
MPAHCSGLLGSTAKAECRYGSGNGLGRGAKRNLYDKILLLVKHGEDESLVVGVDGSSKTGTNSDPSLTGRGVGQTLNVSRQVATFAMMTRVSFRLVVAAPLRRAVDTAMLVFPGIHEFGSFHSVALPPGLTDVDDTTHRGTGTLIRLLVRLTDRSTDWRGCVTDAIKQELIRRSDESEWLRNRDEQIIVVSLESTTHPQ